MLRSLFSLFVVVITLAVAVVMIGLAVAPQLLQNMEGLMALKAVFGL